MQHLFTLTTEDFIELLNKILDEKLKNEKGVEAPVISPNDILTLDDLSRYVHLSKSKLYKLVADKKIETLKGAAKLLFRRSDIDRWLEANA